MVTVIAPTVTGDALCGNAVVGRAGNRQNRAVRGSFVRLIFHTGSQLKTVLAHGGSHTGITLRGVGKADFDLRIGVVGGRNSSGGLIPTGRGGIRIGVGVRIPGSGAGFVVSKGHILPCEIHAVHGRLRDAVVIFGGDINGLLRTRAGAVHLSGKSGGTGPLPEQERLQIVFS